MTPEGRVVAYLRKRVVASGGATRKVAWEGRVGAPDWLVMLNGKHCFIEAKTPTGIVTPMQKREHERMRALGGCLVYVVRCPEDIDKIIEELRK